MKKLMVLVLAGCLVVMSPGFSKGAADDDDDQGDQIPLRKLAGIYSETLHGSIALCLGSTPFQG
jgi:hypothetical protein